MKKWIATLICLGYFTLALGTAHDTFLVTGEDLREISFYPNYLQTPGFFTQLYPKSLNPNLVIVPRTNSGFLVGVTGILGRIFDNQLDYTMVSFREATGMHRFSPFILPIMANPAQPTYKPGLGAYMGYAFPYTGKDILFDFTLFATSHSHSSGSSSAEISRTPFPLPLHDPTISSFAVSSRLETDLMQAKLLVGEKLFAGTRLRLHPSFGLKYAYLNRRLVTHYTDATSILRLPLTDFLVTERSQFNGIGPAVHFDGAYFLTPHVGIVGHLTNALLIGSLQSGIRTAENLRLPPAALVGRRIERIDRVTPADTFTKTTDRAVANIDAKIGLIYERPFCGSLIKMDLELGYDFNHFFNAIDVYRRAGGELIFSRVREDGRLINTFIDAPFFIKPVQGLSIDGPYLSLGLSGIACPNNAVIDPICVTVPRLEGGFVFGIGALYYRVQSNQRDYAILDPRPIPSTTLFSPFPTTLSPPLESVSLPPAHSTLKDVKNNYSYGFMANIGYILPNSPYDITAHFEETHTHKHRFTAAPFQRSTRNIGPTALPIPRTEVLRPREGVVWPLLTTPLLNSIENRLIAQSASANIAFNYEEFHVDLGQAINADSLLWLRVFEGFEYATIKQHFRVTYDRLITAPAFPTGGILFPIPIIPFPTPIFFPQEEVIQNSHFRGLGPRFGMDIGLPMGDFTLVSELATGFLLGSTDASYADYFQTGWLPNAILGEFPIPVIPPQTLGTRVESATQFSPFFDLKIGLLYTWNFLGSTKWSVELGYKAAHYFNSLTTFRHITNAAAVYAQQVGDTTINGPYLDLTVFGFGACPPDCTRRDPFCVYVPELKGGLELAFENLHLKPHTNNIDYGLLDPLPVSIPAIITIPHVLPPTGLPLNPSAQSEMKVLKPRYHSGVRAHIGYIFPLTSNDISINLMTYKESASEFTTARTREGVIWTVTAGNLGLQTPLESPLFPVLANRADASIQFDWQTYNIELGKRVKFYNLMTRFFTGLTYGKVKEDISITYGNGIANFLSPVPIVISSDSIRATNNFSGVGPRLGIAADLALWCGFSAIGQVGTDLLLGKLNGDYSEISSFSGVTIPNSEWHKRFVPALDSKIGLAYSITLKDCAQFSLEAGYQTNHYFNVKDSLRFTDYAATFAKQNQDIGFSGPYGRLQFNF